MNRSECSLTNGLFRSYSRCPAHTLSPIFAGGCSQSDKLCLTLICHTCEVVKSLSVPFGFLPIATDRKPAIRDWLIRLFIHCFIVKLGCLRSNKWPKSAP